jgi:hypothetical protein
MFTQGQKHLLPHNGIACWHLRQRSVERCAQQIESCENRKMEQRLSVGFQVAAGATVLVVKGKAVSKKINPPKNG